MALTSPGVQVSVVDESFYTPAGPGTRPLIIVASATKKQNGSGTGVAPGTLTVNAGRVFTITSQRELVETFGDPIFKVDSNNTAIHAAEQNEYGLQAAYSFLGVSNSVQVVRASLDLSVLNPLEEAPSGEPQDGTFWLDTGTSKFGIFEWDGSQNQRGSQSFTNKSPLLILTQSQLSGGIPKASVGAVGDYAIAVGSDATGTDNDPDADDRDTHELAIFYKALDPIAGAGAEWVKVGSSEWARRWPAAQATIAPIGGVLDGADNFTIQISSGNTINLGTGITSVAALETKINDALSSPFTAQIVSGFLVIYSEGAAFTLVGNGWADLGLSTSTTYRAPELAIQPHTQVPLFRVRDGSPRPTGSVWIKTTEPNAGASWRLKRYNDQTQLWEASTVPHYASSQAALAALDPSGGGLNIPLNATYVQGNFEELTQLQADFRVMRRARVGANTIRTKEFTSIINPGTFTFTIKESLTGSSSLNTVTVSVPTTGGITPEILATAIANATPTHVTAEVEGDRVVISHTLGGDMRFGGTLVASLGLYGLLGDTGNNVNVYNSPAGDTSTDYVASNWVPLTITPDTAIAVRQSYYIQSTEPGTLIADGTLWYNSIVDEVDIMIHNGTTWVGYLDTTSPYYDNNPALRTDINGPIVGASQPVAQSDGSDLVEGDLWIDTSDLENYPLVKRYDPLARVKWVDLDKSDQTSENGILFGDARWSTDGTLDTPATIASLLTSNYLDPDAPDPALYPRGMLLWNLRRSGFNVKRFSRNYIDVTGTNRRFNDENTDGYYPHRWVTESGNQEDGSGSFGRKAQRKVIIQSLQATVNSNEQIRDTERNTFNLIACPGYPELIGEMISLNYDRGVTAFIVGDTPARLRPDATSISEWGTNLNGALQDDDNGLVSFDEYLGVFYPWGFTSDNLGRDVVVPPSHMILRMIALNDQVAYPWFAPAGTRRGGITNATSVGYVTSEGEFEFVALNEGQRDTLYNVKVNPITFFVASGLVNFGQKTRARNASALDRINVARLVIYLREQLNTLAKPYIFEPNDKITRDEIKQQVEVLLVELVGLRALYDFLVVCDESNNTPNRIDRNELYVDIAIEPVKAVEFIYIPVRLKNTGEIAGL